MGRSSRTSDADTTLFSRRFFSSAFFSSTVFPSFRTTCIRALGLIRIPKCPRPRGSSLLDRFGPFVTHASPAQTRQWTRPAILLVHTYDKFRFSQPLVSHRMVSCGRQHVHYPRTCALLAKLHLEYRVVYRLPGNLPPEQVQFAMRNFELGSRVFVLQNSSKR